MADIQKKVTWDQVQNSKSDTVWWSSRTVWWTDDEKDLQDGPIPLDIFGAPLLMGSRVDFLKAAASKPEHYGSERLNTFMASHHKNIVASKDERLLFTGFKTLNDILVAKRMTEQKGGEPFQLLK